MKKTICQISALAICVGFYLCAHEAQANLAMSLFQNQESDDQLQVSTHHLNFAGETSQDVDISSNTTWQVDVLDSWITTTASFGKGDATIGIIVAENDTDSARIGEISISTEGIGRSIVVNQAGKATKFQLSLEAENGIIQATAGPLILAGDSVRFTAVADTGYVFKEWQGDIAGMDNPLSIVMRKDMQVGVLFVEAEDTTEMEGEEFIKSYNLTVNSIGQGKTFAPEVYVNGDTVTVSAEPVEGWVFAGWAGDTTSTEKQIDVIINSDLYITATFEKITYSVATMSEFGSIQRYPKKDRFQEGERISLIAEPDEGYEFVAWDGIIAQGKKITIPIYSNVQVKAIFRKVADMYSVEIEAEDFSNQQKALVEKRFHGFSGEGHIILPEDGSYVEYKLHVPVKGQTDLSITYLGAPNSQIHLFVNGSLHSSVDLPNSGTYWNLWETSVDLLQGENTVRISRKQSDLALDYIEVSNVIHDTYFRRGVSMVIYPNPATNFLNLSIPADVVITDSRGQTVFEGENMDRINVENLEAGLYLLSSEGQVSEVTIKD